MQFAEKNAEESMPVSGTCYVRTVRYSSCIHNGGKKALLGVVNFIFLPMHPQLVPLFSPSHPHPYKRTFLFLSASVGSSSRTRRGVGCSHTRTDRLHIRAARGGVGMGNKDTTEVTGLQREPPRSLSRSNWSPAAALADVALPAGCWRGKARTRK